MADDLPALSRRQLKLFGERPLMGLPDDLLAGFAGRMLAVKAIVEQHGVGTPFIPRNYKRVLRELEERGLISCEPDRESRPKGTMADHVLVSFPNR